MFGTHELIRYQVFTTTTINNLYKQIFLILRFESVSTFQMVEKNIKIIIIKVDIKEIPSRLHQSKNDIMYHVIYK